MLEPVGLSYPVVLQKIEQDLGIAISPLEVGSLGFFHICLWIALQTRTHSVQERCVELLHQQVFQQCLQVDFVYIKHVALFNTD